MMQHIQRNGKRKSGILPMMKLFRVDILEKPTDCRQDVDVTWTVMRQFKVVKNRDKSLS